MGTFFAGSMEKELLISLSEIEQLKLKDKNTSVKEEEVLVEEVEKYEPDTFQENK